MLQKRVPVPGGQVMQLGFHQMQELAMHGGGEGTATVLRTSDLEVDIDPAGGPLGAPSTFGVGAARPGPPRHL